MSIVGCQQYIAEKRLPNIGEIGFTLLATYFVFNIYFVKGRCNVFSFLEILYLNVNLDKMSPSVKCF